MSIKNSPREISGSEVHGSKKSVLEYLHQHKQTFGKNRDIKGAFGEDSEGNMLLETGSRGIFIIQWEKSYFVELQPVVI